MDGMPVITADQVVPPTDSYGRIFQTVVGVKEAYVNYFEEREVELPTDAHGNVVAFVSDGEVAMDQAMLAFEVMSIRSGRPGTPGTGPIGAGTEYVMDLGLTLLREVPTLDTDGVPHPEQREKAAQVWLLDWSIILDGANEMTARAMEGVRRTLTGWPYRQAMVQSMAPYGPSGGFGGVIGTLEVQLV